MAVAGILRIADPAGEAIPGAVATWTDIRPDREGSLADFAEERAPRVEPAVLADEGGRIEVDDLEASRPADAQAVLWVTHPGFLATGVLLAGGEALPKEIVLQRGPRIDVTVVDEQGRPIAGCQLFGIGKPALEGLPAAALERPSLRRALLTDDAGRAAVPHLGESQSLAAYHGAQRSSPWTGSAPARVRLEIGGTFTASGRVLLPQEHREVDLLHVKAWVATAVGNRWIGQTSVRDDGAWGPMTLGLTEATGLALRLDGGELVPEEKRMPLPAAGTHLVVDFEPRVGIAARVRVADVGGAPLDDAAVEIWWQGEGGWLAAYGRTGSDGLARVGGCVPGSVWVRARHPGFVSSTSQAPATLTALPQDPFEVRLTPSGTVSGRVVAQGRPVEAFKIICWDVDAAKHTAEAFAGSERGEFVLRDVPLGRIELLAVAPGHAPSEPRSLDLRADASTELVLELQMPGVGSGRVVHALTGEPLAEAEVVLLVGREGRVLDVAGAPVKASASGEFELGGLAAGPNHLDVRAPGFWGLRATVTGTPGERAEIGSIPLAPTRDLVVRLVGDRTAPPEAYTAELAGAAHKPSRPFESDGTLTFEGVGLGQYTIRTMTPDGPWIELDAYMTSGSSWTFDVDVTSGAGNGVEVEVDLEEFPAECLDPGINVKVATQIEGRLLERLWRLPDSGRLRLTGPLGEDALVHLIGPGPTIVGSRRFRVSEHRQAPVRVRYEGRSYRFRVLDADGEPVQGAWLRTFVPGFSPRWRRVVETDLEGRAALPGLAIQPLEVYAVHLVHGISAPLRIEHEPDEREIVIELGGRHPLILEFRDLAVPLAGLAPTLLTSDARQLLYCDVSSATGRTRIPPPAAGRYLVRIDDEGYWPIEAPVEMRAEPAPTLVQVRRLGGLRVRVEAPGGAPVGGARVDLVSQELGASFSQWLAEGRVAAADGGLVTGADGELRFAGLPNGSYRWSVEVPGAEPLQGAVQVPPHALGALRVVLEP